MNQYDQFREILAASVRDGSFHRAVFSGPRAPETEIRRVDVRPVLLRGVPHLQFARRTRTQEFHDNLPVAAAVDEMLRMANDKFRNVRLETTGGAYSAQFKQPLECTFSCDPTAVAGDVPVTDHDRTRHYLIPEGTPCVFLERIGVMNSAGQVRTKARRKFRQINHYLNLIRDCLKTLPEEGPIHVVDFGCGKSYLTFATHHLLTSIFRRDCRITGLDLRRDVIDDCTQVAQSLGLCDLTFAAGDIASFDPPHPVHIAMSLHACNTATDDALFQAVNWGCDVILAVPCCHQELAGLLQSGGTTIPLMDGILRERFCALATDAMRTEALNAVGYDADIIEFIDTEHTPKNLMIRALRKGKDRQNLTGQSPWAALEEFRARFGLPEIRLERRLTEQRALS